MKKKYVVFLMLLVIGYIFVLINMPSYAAIEWNGRLPIPEKRTYTYNMPEIYKEDKGVYVRSRDLKLQILNIEEGEYNDDYWKITYKGTGDIAANKYTSSGSKTLRIKINGSSIQFDDYYKNSSGYYYRYKLDGTEHTINVPKSSHYNDYNPMELVISYDLYARYDDRRVSKNGERTFNMNTKPYLVNELNRNHMNGKNSSSITVKGKVWDIEQDDITITAELNGITKSKYINIPNASQSTNYDYEFTFDLSEYPTDFSKYIKVTAQDHYGDYIYTNNMIYVDRINPIVSTKDTFMLRGGDEFKVSTNEQSDVYLLKNDRSYYLYTDVMNAISNNKGVKIGNCLNESIFTVPLLNGPYRLFAIDNGKNVSQPSSSIVQIDSKIPELVDIRVENNQLIFIYDDAISNRLSGSKDFLFPLENIISSSVCILADEENVAYEFIFDDYESDEKYTDRFVFSAFSNTMFTTTNGIPDIIGKTASTKNTFHEVGKYTLEYQAQDTPVSMTENRFDNYRKWSNKNNVELLVHRRPIADLAVDATIQSDTWVINSIVGSGYDLDHMDMTNKGIVEEKYEWKKATDSTFTSGPMPSGLPTKENNQSNNYIIKYRVKDIEGAWSKPVTYILNFNLLFDAKLKTEKSQPLTRTSTDQNLITYDAVTTCPYDVRLELALYDQSGTNPVAGTNTLNVNHQQGVTGTKVGLVTNWNNIHYYIPKNTPENWYTFKATAISTDGQSITKEWKVYLINNTPPTVNIHQIEPNFIYENDQVKAIIQVNDADLDELTVTVSFSKDGQSLTSNGYPKTYTVSPNTANQYELLEVPLIDHIELGNYEIHILVDDDNGGTDTDTYTITPSPLSITGNVDHHPKWNDNRIKYNLAKTGSDNQPRDYNIYWSGERFILSAQTTAINSASQVTVTKVSVNIVEPARISPQPYRTNLSPMTPNPTGNGWSGELWDNTMIYRWGRPDPEDLTFHFIVYYSNGAIKQNDVTVTVDDREAYFKYHRKW